MEKSEMNVQCFEWSKVTANGTSAAVSTRRFYADIGSMSRLEKARIDLDDEDSNKPAKQEAALAKRRIDKEKLNEPIVKRAS